MRLHVLTHVPFEDEARIGDWAEAAGHALARTPVYEDGELPRFDAFDGLIVMGGPMSVNDEDELPWLVDEKALIGRAIRAGRPVLGVCLGAQMIASALGARVYRNPYKEIGWFPVALTGAGKRSALFEGFPDEFPAFHWHGETFDLPEGARHVAETRACRHQAFEIGDRVVGLQFHLEATPDSVRKLVDHCSEDLLPAKHVQGARSVLAGANDAAAMHGLLERLLGRLFPED